MTKEFVKVNMTLGDFSRLMINQELKRKSDNKEDLDNS